MSLSAQTFIILGSDRWLSEGEMVVVRPMRDENDLEQVFCLTAAVFGNGRADELYEFLKKAYLTSDAPI